MRTLFIILVLSFVITGCSSNSKKMSPKERRAKIYYGQGTRNLVDKEYTKALKNLLEANAIISDDTKIHTNLGMAYYFKKNNDRAIRHLKRAIELDKKNTDAKLNLATINMELGNYDEAERGFKSILDDLTYEQQFRTYFNLGILEMKRKQLTKAVSYFKSSVENNENYCPSFFQLGKIYYSSGKYRNSLKMFREASMGTCYENPEPHYMQALSLIKLKRFPDAKIKLEAMTEKFALTKYEAMARRALVKVNELEDQRFKQRLKAQNYKRNISTPDF